MSLIKAQISDSFKYKSTFHQLNKLDQNCNAVIGKAVTTEYPCETLSSWEMTDHFENMVDSFIGESSSLLSSPVLPIIHCPEYPIETNFVFSREAPEEMVTTSSSKLSLPMKATNKCEPTSRDRFNIFIISMNLSIDSAASYSIEILLKLVRNMKKEVKHGRSTLWTSLDTIITESHPDGCHCDKVEFHTKEEKKEHNQNHRKQIRKKRGKETTCTSQTASVSYKGNQIIDYYIQNKSSKGNQKMDHLIQDASSKGNQKMDHYIQNKSSKGNQKMDHLILDLSSKGNQITDHHMITCQPPGFETKTEIGSCGYPMARGFCQQTGSCIYSKDTCETRTNDIECERPI